MIRYIIASLILSTWAHSAPVEESLALVLKNTSGRIALCTPSIMDELQVIGTPRILVKDDAQFLARIFGAESSFFEMMPNGEKLQTVSMCMAHWNFKLLLFSSDHKSRTSIQLCTSCRQVRMETNGVSVDLPNIREPAFEELSRKLDLWFPGWKKISEVNKQKWEEELGKTLQSE